MIPQAVVIVIKDQKGNYFLHRRRPNRFLAPSSYGLGASGKVKFWESPARAAARELFEETGIKAKPFFLTSFTAYLFNLFPYRVHLFEITHPAPIKNCNKEWQNSFWTKKEKVKTLLSQKPTHPHMLLAWQKFKNINLRT